MRAADATAWRPHRSITARLKTALGKVGCRRGGPDRDQSGASFTTNRRHRLMTSWRSCPDRPSATSCRPARFSGRAASWAFPWALDDVLCRDVRHGHAAACGRWRLCRRRAAERAEGRAWGALSVSF